MQSMWGQYAKKKEKHGATQAVISPQLPKEIMQPHQRPDSLHLGAAKGWLELGNHLEANEELEKITAKLRAHPDVVELRLQIYAKEKKWDACLDIAKAITELAPERAFGWLR